MQFLFPPSKLVAREHKKLYRLLNSRLWSLAELEWLAKHVKDVPEPLEKLIHTKLQEARYGLHS
jgi:hypothetical protein